MEEAEDDDIAGALRRGDDETAFTLLTERHGDAVLKRCLDLLRDRGLAEDAVQTTMVKTLRNRDQLHHVRKLRPWLLTVAENTSRDTLRSRKRHHDRIERLRHKEVEMVSAVAPKLASEADREHAALMACLDSLEPDTRTAVLRRHQDDAPWDEIAAELELEVDTVRMRVKRALQSLKGCVERKRGLR